MTQHLDGLVDELRGFLAPPAERPLFPGAVVLAAFDGTVLVHEAIGHAVRYVDADGTELSPTQQVPMTPDTIFDVASLTKLFTSIVVMQLVEAGRVELDAPVARYLPAFANRGKNTITCRHLLTHTSGLPWLRLWRDHADREARVRAALDAEPAAPPGTTYRYNDLNLIVLGLLAERVAGESLDALVSAGITEPLGMADTGFNPLADRQDRIAATEYSRLPPVGMLRGVVHDENARSLGGVAGHAGIFSTAADLSRLAEAIASGGVVDGRRILAAETVRLMLTNANTAFPGDDRGLGFDVNKPSFMGALSSPETAGHTGFTGTSLVVHPPSRSWLILLTNRVHPSREWSDVGPARIAAAGHLAAVIRRHRPEFVAGRG